MRHAVLLLASWVSACSQPAEVSAPRPNLILLSIDTLRADHLGCYGYERATSPAIDALARESVRFETALAPTPWTFPSHAAMLSGTHPLELGIDNSRRTIPDDVPLLAEHLALAGYRTAAFVDSGAHGFVGIERGFGRGFHSFSHAPHRDDQPVRFDVASTVDAALDWIGNEPLERPFFVFLHTKSVHAVPNDAACETPRCFPYDNPERYRFVSEERAQHTWSSPEEGSAQRYLWSQNAKILKSELDPATYPREQLSVLRALYDSGIYHVDKQVGRFVEELRRRGYWGETALVLTSDHGEAFLEHSLFMHQEVYETLLRVPLIVKLPSQSPIEPHVSSSVVSLTDIAPTLLELGGVHSPDAWTGAPLPLDQGGQVSDAIRDHVAYYLFPARFDYRAFAIRRGRWKVVYHNIEAVDRFRAELYDLEDDPHEEHPLDGFPERLDELQRALHRRMAAPPMAQGRMLGQEELPDMEAIRTLGYVE